ncbi:putative SAWADEE domain-containing protein [Rosa chinensis]|uniref:Putative SAWADEE domain-containing protein n=1 Tax=Rosa chinensis TaxID=74649 RepID=A0A2P6QAX6_ROSCH|nr:uncharacterized protein LOC112202267 [Rosa chinensis]PRQ31332.1 putative SAWADEE domain-containing protein [Rosa chinensis]
MALEFRSHKDDAWYDARLFTEDTGAGLRLRITFANFSDAHDEFVGANDLAALPDLDALRSRVRRLSLQLQDSECSSVDRGLLVCAARSVHPDDRRFFDAFVDGVVHEEHRVGEGGQEECTCSFILEWIHGPQVGTLSVVALENICRVRLPAVDEEIDPALTSFVNAVKEKMIENTFSNSIENSGGGDCDNESSSRLRKRHKGSSSQLNKDTSHVRRSLTPSSSSKEIMDNISARDGHDMDVGGLPHMILVENLEKGISSFTIMEFIYQQLSISCKAFVSLSKQSEVYTRGTIMLNSKKNLDKLSEFLGSPDRIIISSTGRPWVLTEKIPMDGTIRASIEPFKRTSQATLECKTPSSNEVKVIMSGSPEYTKAKQLKDLFEEFTNHQCGLHQRLLQEEGKIMRLAM